MASSGLAAPATRVCRSTAGPRRVPARASVDGNSTSNTTGGVMIRPYRVGTGKLVQEQQVIEDRGIGHDLHHGRR